MSYPTHQTEQAIERPFDGNVPDEEIEELKKDPHHFLAWHETLTLIILSFFMITGFIYFLFVMIPMGWQWVDNQIVTQDELTQQLSDSPSEKKMRAVGKEICALKYKIPFGTPTIILVNDSGYLDCITATK